MDQDVQDVLSGEPLRVGEKSWTEDGVHLVSFRVRVLFPPRITHTRHL